MAVQQADFDAVKAILDTEITNIKTDLSSLRGVLDQKTGSSDFQKLQQSIINDLAKISQMFDDVGDQLSKHVRGLHAEVDNRLAALEKEAKDANAQRQELHARLAKAETAAANGAASSTYLPPERQVQGAKFSTTFDQENGKISFDDWAHKLEVYMTAMFIGAHKTLSWGATQKDTIDLVNVPPHLMTQLDVSRLSETLYGSLKFVATLI